MIDQESVEFARQLANMLNMEAYRLFNPQTRTLINIGATQAFIQSFMDGRWSATWLFDANGVPLKK